MQTQIEEFSDFIKYESQFGLRVVLKDLIEINRLYFRKRYIQNIIHFADKEKFRFTFFVRSFDIEKKVGLLKKLKKSGHEIASHGHTHVLYENKSHNWLYKELNKSKRVFQKYNFQIKGFRSPFLSENKYLSDVLEKLEFNYVSNKFFNINENKTI